MMTGTTHGPDEPEGASALRASVGGCVRWTGFGVLPEPLDEPDADDGADEGAEDAVSKRVSTFAEQMTRAPPPFVDPLHWLIVTKPDASSPVAVHVSSTSVPPLAEPLHCVMSAPLVVAGKGSHPVVIPPPEPTHWFTVTATASARVSTYVFVT